MIEEIDDRYHRHGVREFHLYDDDLLEDSQNHFEIWAKEAIKRFPKARFHVPNALLIGQLTLRNAEFLKELRVKPIVLGVDAVHEAELLGRWWVSFKAIKDTVSLLERAGFKRYDIKIYVHVSHPTQTLTSLLETIRFLLELGVRPALNRYTPIPGTRLFNPENQQTDLALLNNKTYGGVANGSEAITRKDFGKLKGGQGVVRKRKSLDGLLNLYAIQAVSSRQKEGSYRLLLTDTSYRAIYTAQSTML